MTPNKTNDAQVIGRVFRPFLLLLALTALLLLLLAASLVMPHRQSISGAILLVIFLLLAFGGFRVWSAGQNLRELFAGQITRQEHLDALSRRHFLLSAALSGIGDAVIAADPGGRITLMNPVAETLTAWQEVDAVGRQISAVLTLRDEKTGAALDDPAAAILAASVKLDFPPNAALVGHTGERRPIAGSGTPIWEEHGKPGGVALVFRDISAQRDAAAALRQAQEAALAEARAESRDKSVLLANMSDELRTPLNAVIGYSEMLQEEAADRNQSDLLPDLQKIHSAGKHLLSLINDILDLSKIEAGQMELYPETFGVAEMLTEVTTAVQPILAKNENTLQFHAAALGTLSADRIKTQQSLLNLLSNAASFSHGRTIVLDAFREQDKAGTWITFRVADASADLSAPLRQQLRQTALSPETPSVPRFSGHGLALVMARRFCEMQGGEFVGSREPGHGAVYSLRFPAK